MADIPRNAEFEEHRLDPREPLELPLKLANGVVAVTRDISAGGLFFEIAGEHELQGALDFEMQLPEVRMKFTCVGEIVRVEHSDSKTGIAVRLLSPRLESIDDGA